MKRTCHPIFWFLIVSLAVTKLAAQFDPVEPTGLPYHVIITAVLIDSVPAAVGTEIGIFDDTLGVGVGMVTSDSGNIDIVTWEGSTNPYLPGFTSGNPITAMLYADIYGVMMYVDTELDFDVGSGLFGSGSYSVVSITSVTGIAPDIHIDQTSLSFDPVYVDESDTLFVKIENLGNALLTIDAIYSDTDQFSINYNNAQISAGDSLDIAIGFTATDESFFSGNIIINSDDPDEPVLLITLQGQGIPVPQAEISVSTTNLDYGAVSVGSSVLEQVQVFNTGSQDLNVTSLSLSSASAPFSVQENSFTVAPGGTYGLDITFTPTSAGSSNEQLTLESNAGNNSSVSISLSGLGYDGYFNPVAPTGLPYSIIISALDIDGHGLSNGDEIGVFEYDVGTSSDVCVGSYFYQGENDSSIQVVAWESDPNQGLPGFTAGNDIILKLWVTTYDSTLELEPIMNWSEGDGTFGWGQYSVASLAAESLLEPVIAVDASEIQFAPVEIGNTSEKLIVVSNGGISNLYVNNLSFSDNAFSASEYSFTVTPQDSHEVSVYFTPMLAIPYIGTLTIQNNDPITPLLEVSLAGQGFPVSSGELQASSELIEFGYTVVGDTSTILVFLFNIGSAPITVSAVEFNNAMYFSSMDGDFMINPGETMNLPISFAPTEIGPVECVITIPNSSTNNPNFWLNANGMGFEGFFHIVEPTGLPYTIVVDSLVGPMDSIQVGDEIGIFDGSTAVGVIVAGALNPDSGYNLAGVAWQADPDNGLEGFTPGNPMTFRYFARRNGVAAIYDANHAIISGTGNFGSPPFTVVTVTSGSDPLALMRIQDIPDVSIMEDSGPDTVSDNLNDHFFHPLDSLEFGVLSNDTNAVNVSVDETASLIVTPLENWFGVVDIYVSATDGYFYAYDTVAVSVQNVNDSPVISTLPDTTTLEDVTLILPVTIYDVDGDDLEISAQVDSNIVTVVVDEQSLLIQPTPDSSGTTAIALIVSDGLLQDTTSFLLTIVPLNDAPVISEIPDLNMFEDDTLYYIVEVTDIEGDSITLSAEPAIGDVVVNISATELEIIPAANWFGDTEINITASDGSMESSVSAALHVENVNDAPQPFALDIVDSVFIDMDNINTDSLTLTWAVAGDTDGDPITYLFTAELRALESAGGAVLFNMDTIITTSQAKVAYDLLAELIDEQELVNGELEWDVIAMDGVDSTWSANGPVIVLVDIQGTLGVEEDLLPLAFALYQNYPNPFNPTTIITYDLPEAAHVELVIYDLLGQCVATMKNGRQEAGSYQVRWNGTNDLGAPVSTGLYFYQLNSTPFSATRKMVFMK